MIEALAHPIGGYVAPPAAARQPYLLNRMFIAIARPVSALVEELFGTPPLQVDGPAALPPGAMDLLVVGRQSLPAGRPVMRYGFEVLPAALERAQPALIFYVVPGSADSLHYAADFRLLDRIADDGSVFVLEFDRLQALGVDAAARVAARKLGQRRLPGAAVPLLR